jgi:Putative porin
MCLIHLERHSPHSKTKGAALMQPGSRWLVLTLFVALSAALFAQSSSPSKPKRTPASSNIALDLQALRDLVTAQQQQLQAQGRQVDQLRSQLQQLMDATERANAAAQKGQSSAEQAQSTAALAQQSAAEAQHAADQAAANAREAKSVLSAVDSQVEDDAKHISSLQEVLGRFRFSGDIRVRGEGYQQDPVPDRNRARIRVRLGLDGKLGEDFMGGVALATGALGDPTSTNETLTNVFNRKTIALDRAFISYNPVDHHWLSVTGGKFAYTWQRTSATFDPDLNPEGFNEKFSFDFQSPWMKNFTIQGIELLYNEANGKAGLPSQDSYALGGQVSARFQIGPWTAAPSFLSLKWNRPDAILQESAFAAGATTTGSSSAGSLPVPGEGQGCAKGLNFPAFAPCVFAPNGLTNATFVDAKGLVHFYSGYHYADFIVNNQIKTGISKLPLNLLVELLDNLDAEAHPLDSKGHIATNLGSQNKQYEADFSIGQTKNKNDFQIGYSWLREEQDSAIASFVESDQRAPTNILQNRIYALWKLRANTVASFTWWRGRVLNTYLENNAALFNNYNANVPTITAPGQREKYLNRLQFDLIYSF